MQILNEKRKCNWESTKLSTDGGSAIGSLVGRDSKEEVLVYWENKGQRQNNHKMLGLVFHTNWSQKWSCNLIFCENDEEE